ncbi:MAG: AbrB/MazE/SpoVT family DNA-binding domain-containing protein [Rhodospirillales bacterium]|nr:MAG: AbrB/MazE/SpoVT family DNA-binding domain-containing protein [Rhodospirillales bacterium]
MLKVKVTTVGSSIGIVLPREVLNHLKVGKGDTLSVVETSKGVELSAYDPEFEAIMESARKGMRKYRNALRELAK